MVNLDADFYLDEIMTDAEKEAVNILDRAVIECEEAGDSTTSCSLADALCYVCSRIEERSKQE